MSFFTVQPLIGVTDKILAAPIETDMTLQCRVEASPKAMNTWFKYPGKDLIHITHVCKFTNCKYARSL